ncbi:hypothetical protein [Paenibacillus thiaminolyticus]|uniref:hypothetical protein n=1 Tax=Paenibacillus thiaminolyticus TaxID=49283 RepID=UPI0011C3DD90|nr:hypothetical protein [Paenibacillus thiaminolyticus]
MLHLDRQFRVSEAGDASVLPAQPGELGLPAPRSFIGDNREAESSDLLHSSTVREHRLLGYPGSTVPTIARDDITPYWNDEY